MGVQLIVHLPTDLARQLDLAAKRLRRSRSDLIREALNRFLAEQTDTRPIERVRDLLGQIESGVPDLGQRHREYLLQRLQNGW